MDNISQYKIQLPDQSPDLPTTDNKPLSVIKDNSLLLLIILFTAIIVSIGIVIFITINKPVNKNNSSKSTPISVSPTPELIDMSGFKFTVESENATPSAFYLVTKTNIKTNESKVIFRIPKVPAVGIASAFMKEDINPFVFSKDQKLLAYNTTETDTDPKSESWQRTIHVLQTDSGQDRIVYRESVDLSIFFSSTNDLKNTDCSKFMSTFPMIENETDRLNLEYCFDKYQTLYDKAPMFFTNDNKKLILIGVPSMAEGANQGIFELDLSKHLNTLTILSKSPISKFPVISPTGKYLLAETTFTNYEDGVITYGEVEITIFSLDTISMIYNNKIKINKPNSNQEYSLKFWDPSFISDQQILVPASTQLLILNIQNNKISDITNEALQGLSNNKTTITFAFYDPKINKILYQVSNNISYSPDAPVFSINPDGTGLESYNINQLL